MTTQRTGGVRCRSLPQWRSQTQSDSAQAVRTIDKQVFGPKDRAIGGAATIGAAPSNSAARIVAAAPSCDDHRARGVAARPAHRATWSARRAAREAARRPIPDVPQTPPSGGLRHRIIKPLSAKGERAVPAPTRPVVSKNAALPVRVPASASVNKVVPTGRKVAIGSAEAKKAIAVRTNLPKRLPVLNDEIALVGSALAEFLRSTAAANDNGSQE